MINNMLNQSHHRIKFQIRTFVPLHTLTKTVISKIRPPKNHTFHRLNTNQCLLIKVVNLAYYNLIGQIFKKIVFNK